MTAAEAEGRHRSADYQEAAVAHDFLPVTSEVLIAGRFKLVVAQPDPDLMENKVRRARGLARAGRGELTGW